MFLRSRCDQSGACSYSLSLAGHRYVTYHYYRAVLTISRNQQDKQCSEQNFLPTAVKHANCGLHFGDMINTGKCSISNNVLCSYITPWDLHECFEGLSQQQRRCNLLFVNLYCQACSLLARVVMPC